MPRPDGNIPKLPRVHSFPSLTCDMDITGLSAARAARVERAFRRALLMQRISPAVQVLACCLFGAGAGLAAALLPSLSR